MHINHTRRGRGSVGRQVMSIGAILLLATTFLVACGSSKKASTSPPTTGASTGSAPSGSTSGSTAASQQATGTPLNVMTIASVNYAGPNYANILDTAKVAGQWINAHGGIQGHPLHVTTCDEQGDPTKTAQCGREAIADHDVAVIGSFSFNGNAIIPELAANHISWFGICCAASTDEGTSPDVQQLGSDPVITSANAIKAVEDGCKKAALVILNVGAADQVAIQFAKAAIKSINGPPLAKVVLVPLTAQDYSPQVAQATSGTDCIEAEIGQANYPSFMQPFVATGAKQRIYGPQGNLDITITKTFGKALEGAVIAGTYSDIALPVWNDYRAALQQYNAPNYNNPVKENYNSLGGLGTWAAYVGFQQIAEKLTGPITAANFLAAAQKATVDLKGMAGLGPIDLSKPFTALGPSQRNLVNRAITFDVVHNGVPVPFDNGKFFDFTNGLTGAPLPAEDKPPAGQAG